MHSGRANDKCERTYLSVAFLPPREKFTASSLFGPTVNLRFVAQKRSIFACLAFDEKQTNLENLSFCCRILFAVVMDVGIVVHVGKCYLRVNTIESM